MTPQSVVPHRGTGQANARAQRPPRTIDLRKEHGGVRPGPFSLRAEALRSTHVRRRYLGARIRHVTKIVSRSGAETSSCT